MDFKATLEAAKKQEMDLRLEICDELLEDKEEGTHNFQIAGYDLKTAVKFNYKLNPEVEDAALTQEELDCIKYKPSLVLSGYRKLEESDNIDEYITVTPATPSLAISWEDE